MMSACGADILRAPLPGGQPINRLPPFCSTSVHVLQSLQLLGKCCRWPAAGVSLVRRSDVRRSGDTNRLGLPVPQPNCRRQTSTIRDEQPTTQELLAACVLTGPAFLRMQLGGRYCTPGLASSQPRASLTLAIASARRPLEVKKPRSHRRCRATKPAEFQCRSRPARASHCRLLVPLKLNQRRVAISAPLSLGHFVPSQLRVCRTSPLASSPLANGPLALLLVLSLPGQADFRLRPRAIPSSSLRASAMGLLCCLPCAHWPSLRLLLLARLGKPSDIGGLAHLQVCVFQCD